MTIEEVADALILLAERIQILEVKVETLQKVIQSTYASKATVKSRR